MRLTPPWMEDPGCRRIVAAIAAAGGEVRFVGGCVRDLLLGRMLGDVDMATTLAPGAAMAALQAAGLKVVPTGIDHGTVTALTDVDRYEITTLRHDVATDGRRAEVAFTADWAGDAARRDFTMNALYLSPDGELHDPTGWGVEDARARHVRFIGDAVARIREDYLRILRFFRFFAELGGDAPDAAGLAACAAERDGLARLSAERVQREMLRLLGAPDPLPALGAMRVSGVLQAVLPEAGAFERLSHLIARQAKADPLLRLAALLGTPAEGEAVARRWRLSNAGRVRLEAALGGLADDVLGDAVAARRAAYRLGRETFRDRLRLARAEGRAPASEVEDVAERWEPPALPVTGRDVVRLGVPRGPEIGRCLAAVEDWWVEDDFQADRPACLERLRAVVSGVGSPGSSPLRH